MRDAFNDGRKLARRAPSVGENASPSGMRTPHPAAWSSRATVLGQVFAGTEVSGAGLEGTDDAG